jgi:hypothetical protein
MELRLVSQVLFVLLTLPVAVLGCSQGISPLSDFDDEEYIFIGEVVGYTQGINAKSLRTPAFGLILTPKEAIHLPSSLFKNIEVFWIRYSSDCMEGGVPLADMEKFKIGMEVLVVAKQPRFLPRSVVDGVLRLEIRPAERGLLLSNLESDGSRITNARSEFNYENLQFDPTREWQTKGILPAFEIRKDLLRLRSTTSKEIRLELLRKLSFAPPSSGLDYYSVAKKYASSIAEARNLFGSQLQRTSPKMYRHYQAVWAASDALMKKGFDLEGAEYESKTAIAGGVELDTKKIVKAVMGTFKVKKEKDH